MINPARWLAVKIMERRKRRTIASLRRELTFWGIRTDHLSDREIMDGCERFGLIAGEMGVRNKDAAESVGKHLPPELKVE